MSQHDYVVDDASGAVVRADLNAALQAMASNNAGTSAPGTTYANMGWADTTDSLLKRRNAANTAWIIRDRLAAEGLVTKAAGFTAGVADFGRCFLCTAALTAAFAAAATLTDGWHAEFRNASAGDVVLDPNAAELVDGAATLTLKPGESAKVWCNGSALRTTGLPPAMTGDSGSGGVRGLVGAPAAGDAAAGKFWKADASWAVPAQGLVLIEAQDGIAAATLDFDSGISSTYDAYVIEGFLRPVTDDVALWLRVAEAGPAWQSDAADYRYAAQGIADSTNDLSVTSAGTAAQMALHLGGSAFGVGNDASEGIHFRIAFFKPSSTAYLKQFDWKIGYVTAGGRAATVQGSGHYTGAAAIVGARLLFSSGDIADGWAALYGLKKS